MPTTLPAHPAAVAPLKVRYPRRFDGVALVVGSTVPDLAYVLQGLGPDVHSHAWHSLFWFSLPLTLLIAAVVRLAAPFVAAHLPHAGVLALRDYGVLAAVRHPLAVRVWSALLGAFSHLAWDTFTHPYILFVHPFHDGQTYLPALHATAVAGLPWWRVVHLSSELIGTAIVLATAVHIGRRRLLLAWHGPAPAVPYRPALFWPVAGAACAVSTAAALALPGNGIGPNVIGMRLIVAVAVALVAGAASVATAGAVAQLRKRSPSQT